MDVISLHQAGFTSAVAGCGTALTSDQARLLARYSKNIYLCYDSDEPGQKAAKKAIDLFSSLECNVKVLKVPDGKDPDEFIKKHGSVAFEKLISSARATTRYELDSLMQKFDLDDIGQKVEFSKEAAVLLSKLKSAVELDEYIKYIALKANLSAESLLTEVKKNRSRTAKKELSDNMKTAANPTQNVQKGHQSQPVTRLSKAYSGLLSCLMKSPKAFEKLREKTRADMFPEGIMREIYVEASSLFDAGGAFGISELSTRFQGRESEFSAVFLTGDSIADPARAAIDYINIIEAEDLKRQIAEATKNNDLETLAQLLKKQKSLKG